MFYRKWDEINFFVVKIYILIQFKIWVSNVNNLTFRGGNSPYKNFHHYIIRCKICYVKLFINLFELGFDIWQVFGVSSSYLAQNELSEKMDLHEFCYDLAVRNSVRSSSYSNNQGENALIYFFRMEI